MPKYGAELIADEEILELLKGKGKYQGTSQEQRRQLWNAEVKNETIVPEDLFMTWPGGGLKLILQVRNLKALTLWGLI